MALTVSAIFSFDGVNGIVQFAFRDSIGDSIAQRCRPLQFWRALIENTLASRPCRKGRLSEAIGHYEKAMKLRPDYGDPYFNLGAFYFSRPHRRGRLHNGRRRCDPAERRRLSPLLWATRSFKGDYRKMQSPSNEHAARISPHDPMARNNLAWLLATSSGASIRDGIGNRGRPNKPCNFPAQRSQYLPTLAAAYAEVGSFLRPSPQQSKHGK